MEGSAVLFTQIRTLRPVLYSGIIANDEEYQSLIDEYVMKRNTVSEPRLISMSRSNFGSE